MLLLTPFVLFLRQECTRQLSPHLTAERLSRTNGTLVQGTDGRQCLYRWQCIAAQNLQHSGLGRSRLFKLKPQAYRTIRTITSSAHALADLDYVLQAGRLVRSAGGFKVVTRIVIDTRTRVCLVLVQAFRWI